MEGLGHHARWWRARTVRVTSELVQGARGLGDDSHISVIAIRALLHYAVRGRAASGAPVHLPRVFAGERL